MKRQICVAGGCVSRTSKCRYYNCCRYINYLDDANDPAVDFQITNHNYFLADILHRTGGRRPLFPDYQMVVIDEAHKFLSAARQMYGLEMSDKELPALAESIHSFTDGKSSDGVNVHRLAKKLAEQSNRLFARIRENVGNPEDYEESGCYPAVMDVTTSLNMKNIAATADSIIKALENSYAPERYLDRKRRVRLDLESVMNRASAFRNYESLICWVEDDGEGGETFIRAIPKDLAESLYADVWNIGVPMILTSGTLSASGDFTRTKQTLGIDRVPARLLREVSLPSPFDFKRNALLYFSKAMPVPDHRDKRYISAVSDELERLVRASCGHATVLFTSYNVMGQVYAILNDRRLPFPMFQMGRRDTTALERFKQSGGGVLFASGALWEGIDIPGDALSMLIIVKLPFAAPDPIGDYEKSLCGDMGEYMRRALLPDMLVKLKQGFGRLIRTETDTGVCVILDCRANPAGNYHRRVLEALPPCGVTTNISDITPFLRVRKSQLYFMEDEALCKAA